MNIGFSTGSLALGDFRKAIEMLKDSCTNAIELSALREKELVTLIDSFDTLVLDQYDYISFHAPSKIKYCTEKELIIELRKVADRNISIVLHPDVIQDIRLWRSLGSYLCIENMDKRKSIGRTTADLEHIFTYLPEASFCFDLAHVKQVDPTMSEAIIMSQKLGNRLKQLHVSDVNSSSIHEPLNLEAIISFRRLAGLINHDIPIILETPITRERIELEIKLASLIFDDYKFQKTISNLGIHINSSTGRVQEVI